MATPGPPKKPTALKLVAGNPGKRPLPEHEPKPKIEAPPPPKHLKREALAEWKRITPILARLGLVSALDRAALSAYCQAWARHVQAEKEIAKDSALAKTHNGYPIVNPWVTISKQSVEQICRLLGEFGLTPAARARMGTRGKPVDGEEKAPNIFSF